MADIGVDRIREIDGRRIARQRFDLSLRSKDVDLLGIELDLQVLQELLRVADFLLKLEELPEPDEILFITVRPVPALLVLPMGGDALLRNAVHLGRPDLDLERKATIADD